MPSRRHEPWSDAGRRGEVLRLLKSATRPMSITDIADRLGVHPNTVRFHVSTLVSNGQIERIDARHRAPGRPPQLFRSTVGMDPAGPRHYRLLAEILAETLAADADRGERAVEAGRAWGRQRAGSDATDATGPGDPVGRLVALLDDVGFAPQRGDADEQSADTAPRIELRNCPFLELAVDRPQIACPIHLGLMQGAMAAWQSPVTVDRLEPFVEPDRCVAHLVPVETS